MKRILFAAALGLRLISPADADTLNPWWEMTMDTAPSCYLSGSSPLHTLTVSNTSNERWGTIGEVTFADKGANEVDLVFLPPDTGVLARFFRSEAACHAAVPSETAKRRAEDSALLGSLKKLDQYR
jgi:hypothetical protein